ncbi:MAG: YdcF family protein, partial [Xanthobacteraceae bacterium]
MPRALAELSHQLPAIALIPYPVVSNRLRTEPWWSDADTTRVVVSEYVKFLFAEIRMRLQPSPADLGGKSASGAQHS